MAYLAEKYLPVTTLRALVRPARRSSPLLKASRSSSLSSIRPTASPAHQFLLSPALAMPLPSIETTLTSSVPLDLVLLQLHPSPICQLICKRSHQEDFGYWSRESLVKTSLLGGVLADVYGDSVASVSGGGSVQWETWALLLLA